MRISQKRIIEQMVVKFRQDVGLGSNDAINLKSLLLKLKVVSIFRPLSNEFCGMSLRDSSSCRFMLINSNHSKGRQHFTIANYFTYSLRRILNPTNVYWAMNRKISLNNKPICLLPFY